MIEVKLVEEKPDSEIALENYNLQLAKYKMLDLVLNPKLPVVDIDEYISCDYIKNVLPFWHELKQETTENDANNEQIRLSLIHWNTWGAHYIRYNTKTNSKIFKN